MWCMYIYYLMFSSWVVPLIIIGWCSEYLLLLLLFLLKSTSSDIRMIIPALFFFSFPLAWNLLFHPFSLCLCPCLLVRCVSYRQKIDSFCFLIQFVIYVLIDEYKPFILRINPGRYWFGPVNLAVGGFFCGFIEVFSACLLFGGCFLLLWKNILRFPNRKEIFAGYAILSFGFLFLLFIYLLVCFDLKNVFAFSIVF